ncbi:hypothetical protein [Mesorhizobium sp.]|uniref:hypothetical protein n=1 Tax=Mesorhizobium sp. TaxID=1871066 RepID=UPI000FE5331E|nr:hypothetical protein [Mesorhizobium sp.]RWC31566.1 MAG: hypothetical protein EOS27_10365 [Mesorhizobium sp.]TIX27827.1 MAG: hypothetical protein E5V35_04815 [Mesorhizobium sp.]
MTVELTPLQVRTVRCFDGLHYSFELLDFYYRDLHSICSKIPSGSSNVVPALAHCWGFVDTLHRIRSIALALPSLNQKRQEMRAFLTITQLSETFRHYIQHLSGELSKDSPNTFPVWGSLAWVDDLDDQKSHLVMFGAVMGNTSFTGCVYDTWNNAWVSRVCLTLENSSFNFDPIYEAAMRFKGFVLPFAAEKGGAVVEYREKLPIMTMTMSRGG